MSFRMSCASYLDDIREQRRLLPYVILHFDPVSRDLQLWFWPATSEGVRILPSGFDFYRSSHDFRAPCCLCASEAFRNDYTESAIYVPQTGQYQGEYVVGCAYNRCGYVVAIERMYARRGLLIEKYPFRQPGYLALPKVRLEGRYAEGSLAMQSIPEPRTLFPSRMNKPPARDSQWRYGVVMTDSMNAKFRKLLQYHTCGCTMPIPPAVVNLTSDSSDCGSFVIDPTGESG